MSNLDRAVKKTLAYSSFFNFPLYPEEVHHWLITGNPIPSEAVCAHYHQVLPLSSVEKRKEHLRISNQKMERAKKISSLLSRIPTIEMIAVTGSVAVGAAKELDDVDLLIITSDNSLWFTRPLVLTLLSLFSRRRLPGQSYDSAAHTFCPNLWLEKRSLSVPGAKRNLYTAHEVLFVSPVFDRSRTHSQFLHQNSWVRKHLANAYDMAIANHLEVPKRNNSLLSSFLYPFNLVSFVIQYLYMRPKITTEEIRLTHAYFHTQDFAQKIQKHLIHNLS